MTAQVDLSRLPNLDLVVLENQLPQTAIWPVAGGKGGTGKSTLTANIGLGLALLGYKVILVDGDFGGADLHLFFDQIAPPRSLSAFFNKEVASLKEVLLPTPNENLKLLCGGNEMVGLANLSYQAKVKMIRHINNLEADYVLIDLGAGSTFNTLDFFVLSNDGLIVCTPEPHARVDAYGFLKNTVYRKLDRLFRKNAEVKGCIGRFARQSGSKSGRIAALLEDIAAIDPAAGRKAEAMLQAYRPRLVLNRVRHKRHIEEIQRFISLVREYLSVELEYAGYVRSDDKILDACERRRPVLLESPKAAASRDVFNVLMGGMGIQDRLRRFSADNYRKLSQVAKAEARFW